MKTPASWSSKIGFILSAAGSAIGLSGAAAMDSALPFVKENCEPEYVKYAIVSGFILTLVAPVLISALTALLY